MNKTVCNAYHTYCILHISYIISLIYLHCIDWSNTFTNAFEAMAASSSMWSFAEFYGNAQIRSYLKNNLKTWLSCLCRWFGSLYENKNPGVWWLFGKSIFSGKCFVFLSFLKFTSCGYPQFGGGEIKKGMVWKEEEKRGELGAKNLRKKKTATWSNSRA